MNELQIQPEVVPAETVVRDEKYHALIEELSATWKEGQRVIFTTAAKIDFLVGRSMTDFVEQNKVNSTALVRQIATDSGKSPRSLWSTYMLWKDRPDFDQALKEVADITGIPDPSLSALRRHYLGEGKQGEFNLETVIANIVKKYGEEKALQIADTIKARYAPQTS
jgi:hypothetical protein